MTQITKVEKIVDEMIERKIASLVWSKNASDLNKTLVNGNIRGFKTEIIEALTADRLALLTELRDSGLLKEDKDIDGSDMKYHFRNGQNNMAKAVKAHLDELIKASGV